VTQLYKAMAVALVLMIGSLAATQTIHARASISSSTPLKKKCHYVFKKVHGKRTRVRVCLAVKQPTPAPTPTATATSEPSFPVPDPITIKVIPVNITNYSTIDQATMQQQFAESKHFFNAYNIHVVYDFSAPVTTDTASISNTAPCSTAYSSAEYNYVKKLGMTANAKNVMIYTNFSYDQCHSVGDGLAGETMIDTANGGGIPVSTINFPFSTWVIKHESARQMGANQGDLASCATADCVAQPKFDVGHDVMGAGDANGGLNLVDQIVLSRNPNITPITQYNQKVLLEPRANGTGIKLPFTTSSGAVQSIYCGLRAPVGGDSLVKSSQVVCDVWDGKVGVVVADADVEVPPMDVNGSINDPKDGWNLHVDSVDGASATLTIAPAK
jgi:hypothetical protein